MCLQELGQPIGDSQPLTPILTILHAGAQVRQAPKVPNPQETDSSASSHSGIRRRLALPASPCQIGTAENYRPENAETYNHNIIDHRKQV